MVLLSAFLSTWTQARQTFGSGEPVPGAQFDASATLRQMQSDVERAAPDDRWQGAAANAYAAVNANHAKVFGDLADLEVRLAAEIDNSARIVTAGRDELEKVHDWVVCAGSSVPQKQAGHAVMMSIVSSGLAQVSQTVSRSNSELNAIGASVQKLGAEYTSLSNQKFAGRGPLPQQPQGSDKDTPYDPTPMIDAASWRMEMATYQLEVTAHNEAVAAHARIPAPPVNSPMYPGYLARAQALNSQRDQLMAKQIELAQQAAELGLPAPQFTPPPDFGGAQPQNAVPDSVLPTQSGVRKGLQG